MTFLRTIRICGAPGTDGHSLPSRAGAVNRDNHYAFMHIVRCFGSSPAGGQSSQLPLGKFDMNKLFAALIAAVFAAGTAFAADAKKDEKKAEAKPAAEAKKDAAPAKAEAAPAKAEPKKEEKKAEAAPKK